MKNPGGSPRENGRGVANRSSPLNRIWIQWVQMAGIWLVTLGFLGASLFIITSDAERETFWPSQYTDSLLLCGLGIVLLLLIGKQSVRIRELINLQEYISKKEVETSISNRLMSLRRLTIFVGANVELQKILDHMTETGLDCFHCEQVSIMLLDSKSNELEVLSAAGRIGRNIVGSRQKVGFGVAGKVAETAQAIILGPEVDSRNFVNFEKSSSGISASMVAPIMLREELIGILCVTSNKEGTLYNGSDLQILQVFAEIVAVCIRHAQQAKWLRRTISNLQAELRSAA